MIGFTVTTRTALLALVGALPLALARSWPAALLIFALANGGILWLVWLDLRLTPKAALLDARRTHRPVLSVGEWNDVKVEIMNRSAAPLRILAIDEAPVTFRATRRSHDAFVPARSAVRFSYRLEPPERGDHLFGDVVLVWRGVLGLVRLDARIPASATVKVYPSVRSIARFEAALRRAPVIETGLASERRRGGGTEFESLKEFGRDDEFRRIDWKATARRAKLVAREYQAERNQSVIICLDVSRPMGQRAGARTLLDAAVEASLLLAHAVTRRQDRVGLCAFADRVLDFVPPRGGRAQFRRVLDSLYNLLPEPAEPDYLGLWRHLAERRLRRALVVVITDLSDGLARARAVVGAPAILSRHLPLLVSVDDPALLETAALPARDRESLYRRTVAREFLERRDETLAALSRAGFVALSLTPERLAPELLAAYLRQKARARL